jgi:hypothetical protein
MRASKSSQRLILDGVCAAWAAEDMAAVKACIHRHGTYKHHLPPGAWPIRRIVRGKQDIALALSRFLDDFDVLRYKPFRVAPDGDAWDVRVEFEYGHRLTGHTFEGIARVKVLVDIDRVRSFEVIHDAPRLGAFLELVSRMSIEA